MKKLICILAALMLVTLCACTSDPAASGSSPSLTTDEQGSGPETTESSRESESGEENLAQEAEKAAGEWMEGLLKDEGDHKLLEYYFENIEVYQVSQDGNTMCFSLQIVIKPEDYDDDYWWAGNTKEGSGEQEGYLTWGRQMMAEKKDSGWSVVNVGTGGISLDTAE